MATMIMVTEEECTRQRDQKETDRQTDRRTDKMYMIYQILLAVYPQPFTALLSYRNNSSSLLSCPFSFFFYFLIFKNIPTLAHSHTHTLTQIWTRLHCHTTHKRLSGHLSTIFPKKQKKNDEHIYIYIHIHRIHRMRIYKNTVDSKKTGINDSNLIQKYFKKKYQKLLQYIGTFVGQIRFKCN